MAREGRRAKVVRLPSWKSLRRVYPIATVQGSGRMAGAKPGLHRCALQSGQRALSGGGVGWSRSGPHQACSLRVRFPTPLPI
jgi:hypothetical protein